MTSKLQREDGLAEKTMLVTTRCLAVVLKEKRTRKSEGKNEIDKQTEKSGKPDTEDPNKGAQPQSGTVGREVFEDFQEENKGCYWNPHLEESVKSLKFLGYLKPNVLLLGGRDIHLETIRNAWARKVLRSPTKYNIHRIGEINTIEMTLIAQTQFTPLPDALCLIISELNKRHTIASLAMIQDKLKEVYKGVQQPPEQIIFESLDALIKDRKIYHTGQGYFIVSPDTFPLGGCLSFQDNQLVINEGRHGNLPAVYIPLVANRAEMRSISCQTYFNPKEEKYDKVDKVEKSDTSKKKKPEKAEKEDRDKRLDRSQSMRAPKGRDKKEKGDSLTRSASLRYGEDRAKALVKDINLKTSDAHQDKDKGEKSSLLSKLFGRNKSKKGSQGDTASTTEVEYATFSAQFPPPEWQWYESQVQVMVQQHTQPQYQTHVPKSKTWHHLQQYQDAGTQSDFFDDDTHMHPGHRQHLDNPAQPKRRERSSSSHSSRSSSFDVQDPHRVRSNSHECSPRGKKTKHKSGRKHKHQDENGPCGDVQNKDVSSENPYECIPEQSFNERTDGRNTSGQLNQLENSLNEESDGLNINGQLNEAFCQVSPEHDSHGNDQFRGQQDFQTYASRDAHMLNNGARANVRPNSSRSRNYRKLHCTSFCDNDISIQYHGKLPKRDTNYSMSRDSGVNCVGLTDSHCQKRVPLHRNSNAGPYNNQLNQNGIPDVHLNLNSKTECEVHGRKPGHQVAALQEAAADSGFNSPRTTDFSDNNKHSSVSAYEGVEYQRNPGGANVEKGHQHRRRAEDLSTGVNAERGHQNGRRSQDTPDEVSKKQGDSRWRKVVAYPTDSIESLPKSQISCSAKYPSMDKIGNGKLDKAMSMTTSSSWSSSSKQTVLDCRPKKISVDQHKNGLPNGLLGGPPPLQMPKSIRDGSPMRQIVVRKEPYMEIQLVPECPCCTEDGQNGKQSHRQKSRRHAERENAHVRQLEFPQGPPPQGSSQRLQSVHVKPKQTGNGARRHGNREARVRQKDAHSGSDSQGRPTDNRGGENRGQYLGDFEVVGVV